MPTEKPSFYSVKTAGQKLGVNQMAVYHMLSSGKLKEVRPEQGKMRLVDATSLDSLRKSPPSGDSIPTVPVYTVKATADALGVSITLIYLCLADGRLENVMADSESKALISSKAVRELLGKETSLKRRPGARWTAKAQARLELIKEQLAGGATLQHVGDLIGLSRERVRQLIDSYVPVEERKRKCALCGKPLPPEIAWARHTHPKCAEEKRLEDSREESKRKGYHQRSELTPTEATALEAYKERLFGVVWVPHTAPFDFWVNGKRIDVKGATLRKIGRFTFGIMAGRSAEQISRCHYDDLEKRCDVFHCVGLDGDKAYHLMMPADILNGCIAVVWRPPGLGRRPSMWDEWCDRWDLLE